MRMDRDNTIMDGRPYHTLSGILPFWWLILCNSYTTVNRYFYHPVQPKGGYVIAPHGDCGVSIIQILLKLSLLPSLTHCLPENGGFSERYGISHLIGQHSTPLIGGGGAYTQTT